MELTSRGKGRIKFLLLFTPRRRVSPGHLRSQPNLKLFLSNLPFIFDKNISPKNLTCAWTGVPSSTLPNYVSKTGCFCKRQFYIEWNSESHFFCLAKMWLYATLLLEVQDCNLVREIWDLVWFLVVYAVGSAVNLEITQNLLGLVLDISYHLAELCHSVAYLEILISVNRVWEELSYKSREKCPPHKVSLVFTLLIYWIYRKVLSVHISGRFMASVTVQFCGFSGEGAPSRENL